MSDLRDLVPNISLERRAGSDRGAEVFETAGRDDGRKPIGTRSERHEATEKVSLLT